MKLKLRISPTLTRDQLIERLPAIIQTATEAILEKGRAMNGDIEKSLYQAHPVKAIASHEGEFYRQGHDALTGILSWLLKRLKVETSLKKSYTQDNFRTEFHEKHGLELGSSVTLEQAKDLDKILEMIPDAVLQDRVRLISVDGKFGASKKRYPNHGRYYEEQERIVLNPNIFGEKTIYRDGKGEPIEKVQHTLIHEIGHSLDDDYGFSGKKEWRNISEWKFIGDKEPPEGFERLVLKEGQTTSLKGRWAYKKGTTFARWYGARNPKEDFCEAFAFAVLGAKQYFKGESGKKKFEFVEKIIGKLLKSDNPALGLESCDDTEILKSQSFETYFSTRSAGLVHLDELEAVALAKSEFLEDSCDDVFYKANEGTQSPDIKLPKPAAAPGAAPAPSSFTNRMKGMMRPGHKYLYRETQPDGSYRYFYEMPDGSHYHSKDALHDEAKHLPQLKSEEEWKNYAQGKMQQTGGWTAPEHQVEVEREGFEAAGGKQDFFNPIEVPKLVEDIQPGENDFKGEPQIEKEEDEKRPEDMPEGDWRHRKPKREPQDFKLTEEQEPKIEAALRTWEIEKAEFLGGGINMTFRVKLKNDGWAVMKPKAGSKKFQRDPVRHMDEMTTVYREALAYEVDKALGWRLVSPTVIRSLKGVGNRLVQEEMEKVVGDDHNGVLEEFRKGKVTEASMQFFVDGGKRFLDASGKERSQVTQEEKMRYAIMDMILNHQDRHEKNMMVAPDSDSKSRYGGSMRFVLIDNGYCAGYGDLHNTGVYRAVRSEIVGKFIDKKTLRALRKLRSDIRDKNRRRKVFSEEVRRNITADQLNRVARRIDFLLSAKHRDKLGRVKLPEWEHMEEWEAKNIPIRDVFEKRYEPAKEADQFDITGRTAFIGRGQGKPMEFKDASEMQNFLSPILPYLNSHQKKYVDSLVEEYKLRGKAMTDIPFQNLVGRLPKRMVNQMFVKQKFHERIGLRRHTLEFVNMHVKEYLERDLHKAIRDQIRRRDLELFNKIERGEIKPQDAKGQIPSDLWQKMEDRWLIPRNLRGIGKDLTERIFDDPQNFGWPHEAAAEPGEKPFEAPPSEPEESMGEPNLIINIGE